MQQQSIQRKPYLPNAALAQSGVKLFSKYMELAKKPGPAQNPHGLREVDGRAVEFTGLLLSELSNHPKVKIVDSFEASGCKVSCPSEDGRIVSAIMSPPTYLDWESPINEGEKDYTHNKPDRLRACFQHFSMIVKMVEHGSDVILIRPLQQALEGVFTRDPFFAIGKKMFASNMVMPARFPEEKWISGAIKPPQGVFIEGGNVILGKDEVFLGIGDRTNRVAADWLQWQLGSEKKVMPLVLKPGVLHLDCAFCPIEERDGTQGSALVYSGAFESPKDLQLLHRMYGDMQEVHHSEYKIMGLNILKLDRKTAIVNQGASWVKGVLEKLGIHVVELDYSEMVKAEGAWRCTYAAVEREN